MTRSARKKGNFGTILGYVTEPITEGFVSLLEPFIDTVVICTMTALVIIITQQLVTDPTTGLYLLNEAGTAVRTVGDTSGVGLPLWRGRHQGIGVQGGPLRLRGDRGHGTAWPGDRLLGCGDLCHGGGQPARR